MNPHWVTLDRCRCTGNKRHSFRRAGTFMGDPLFVAPCGRMMRLDKAPVGPWTILPIFGRLLRFDDAFPLRLLGPDDSRTPVPLPLSTAQIWDITLAG